MLTVLAHPSVSTGPNVMTWLHWLKAGPVLLHAKAGALPLGYEDRSTSAYEDESSLRKTFVLKKQALIFPHLTWDAGSQLTAAILPILQLPLSARSPKGVEGQHAALWVRCQPMNTA